MEEALGEVNDQEEELSVANRVLESRLEDVQVEEWCLLNIF